MHHTLLNSAFYLVAHFVYGCEIAKLHFVYINTFFFLTQKEKLKLRATVVLTCAVTNQCVVHHVSATRTAVWLVTAAPLWPGCVIGHSYTQTTSTIIEWFDHAWLQKFVNELAPPTLQTWDEHLSCKPFAQIDDVLKGNDILLLFAILFLWLNLENHLHGQNALIVSEYKIIIF